MCASAGSAAAQEFSGWTPLGALPVDQAGSGRRGYVMAGEDSDVASGRANRLSIHTVVANNFFREQNEQFLITQRYETHTLALDYRRGFKLQGAPRFELGGQVQLHQSNAGMLNGFISAFETMWASMTGYQAAKDPLRAPGAVVPPLGTSVTRNGVPIYQQAGRGSGVGDLTLVAKVALLDLGADSYAPRVALRVAANRAGNASYTSGNYFGVGLSFDQKLSPFLALHGDARATRVLDDVSAFKLPLRTWTYAFSIGPEFRLPWRSSLNFQLDGSTSPYWGTGTLAFDQPYGAITIGVGHDYGPVIAQLYFRENMNLPFDVRWNLDPDLSLGLRIRIH